MFDFIKTVLKRRYEGFSAIKSKNTGLAWPVPKYQYDLQYEL